MKEVKIKVLPLKNILTRIIDLLEHIERLCPIYKSDHIAIEIQLCLKTVTNRFVRRVFTDYNSSWRELKIVNWSEILQRSVEEQW